MLHFLPVHDAESVTPAPYAEAVARLASVRQALRLIDMTSGAQVPVTPTEMEYRVLELLAFARNNVVTRNMLLKHLYRRMDDQPQPKIIDVFISKLRKKLRLASNGAEFVETIPQRGWILRDIEAPST